MKNLFETITSFERLALSKVADHPEREKILREKGLPIHEETENPPLSENKPIDEEKVADYHEMVALRHRIKQLEKLVDEDPYAFQNESDELERRRVELETLLEKRKFQGKPPL